MQASFSYDRLQRLAHIERRHFWFAGRRALVLRWFDEFVPRQAQRVYDLGCGTGALLETFAPRGHRLAGSDLRIEGLQRIRQLTSEIAVAQADATRLPWAESSFDAVLMLDVLEHVDDGVALRELHRVMRPDGWLILTVPALPWLWSYRDEAAGHLRRYTRGQLRKVLAENGFALRRMRYYQFWLLPLVLMTRWLGRRNHEWRDTEDLPAAWVNRILTGLNWSEVWLNRWISWPCGSSLAVVCQRK